jgi:hypothetical protein
MSFNVIRARTAIAALAACGAAAASASAQDGPTVERCRSELTDAARFACLEAAVNAYERGPEAAAPSPTPAPGATIAPLAPAPTSAATAPSGAATAAVAAPAPSPVVASDEPTGIGAEQVVARRGGDRDDEEREPPTEARIVAHSIHGYAQLEVTLDNGQVWRQLQGDNERIRLRGDDPIAVSIRESQFGGYRMQLADPRREIQVERIR